MVAPLVVTFADQFHPMLCHLARSVEVNGGRLQVMGLLHGKEEPLFKTPQVAEAHRWHFEDKFVMLGMSSGSHKGFRSM